MHVAQASLAHLAPRLCCLQRPPSRWWAWHNGLAQPDCAWVEGTPYPVLLIKPQLLKLQRHTRTARDSQGRLAPHKPEKPDEHCPQSSGGYGSILWSCNDSWLIRDSPELRGKEETHTSSRGARLVCRHAEPTPLPKRGPPLCDVWLQFTTPTALLLLPGCSAAKWHPCFLEEHK